MYQFVCLIVLILFFVAIFKANGNDDNNHNIPGGVA